SRLEGVSGAEALAMADAARRAPIEEPLAEAVRRLRSAVARAGELVAKGDREAAASLVQDTYYDAMEPAEEALERAAPGAVPDVETKVNALRDALPQGDAGPAVAALVASLDSLAARVPEPAPKTEEGPFSGTLVLAALAVLAAVRHL